ncbi:MAG: biotin synthase BioB, partial [Eubacterium sp.]|nr:biotin synthase BioB [Candidatus Colimonas fimequi]
CTIVNGRSGKCGEDCKFCAQSVRYNSGCEQYEYIDEDELVALAKSNEDEGVHRYSIVTSGKGPSASTFEKTISAFERLKRECKIDLCASLGFLTDQQFEALYETGVHRYHCNIETSQRNFPNICTTHTYADKMDNLRRAQAAGMSVCSGGIIGLGETWEDRLDMAISLAEVGVDSIPINSLMPIPGTPLEDLPQLTEDDILRTVAFFRYINPQAHIRLAAGRALLSNGGAKAFTGGASAAITGNMLTTTSSGIADDKAMLLGLGRDITPDFAK